MRYWVHLVRFGCPGCGQRLAVERGQIERNEVVTCQDCNTKLRLARRGTVSGGRVDPGSDEPPARLVELL